MKTRALTEQVYVDEIEVDEEGIAEVLMDDNSMAQLPSKYMISRALEIFSIRKLLLITVTMVYCFVGPFPFSCVLHAWHVQECYVKESVC